MCIRGFFPSLHSIVSFHKHNNNNILTKNLIENEFVKFFIIVKISQCKDVAADVMNTVYRIQKDPHKMVSLFMK